MEVSDMSKSIYQLICDNITDDALNEEFYIEGAEDEIAGFRWAPGAMDGVRIYHMSPSGLDADGAREMEDAIKCAAEGDFSEADHKFAKWCKEHRAISNIDRLQNYIMEHARQLDAGNVHRTALSLVMCSENVECVKIGLELLELFGEPNEDVKNVIRSVGLYDEFTIFAVWNMLRWNHGNEDIFRLARKTKSWGRIHAVERLRPETDEIWNWLLTEGTKNTVENAYSSLTCWQKSNAEKLLRGDISDEEYKGISAILEGLLDEGPVPGISEVENSEHILLQFLKQSQKHAQSVDDYHTILAVKSWAEEAKNCSGVLYACDELLSFARSRGLLE
jgi:hypothetical protein